jgi:glucosamine-6-phosphate deaminase
VENIPVKIYEDPADAAVVVARRIAALIRSRGRQGRQVVLGLATGHTPVNVYRELIRMHREEGLDFANVVTFNLDEYWPIDVSRAQSYHAWMHDNLFAHVNIPPANVHLPGGDVPEQDLEAHCREYEAAIEAAGGIDLQILGIGRSGHIGFNEPGSERHSRTRVVRLDRITRNDAASDFFEEQNVPESAITMGVGTILQARQICLLAFGEHKAAIVRRAVEGEVCEQVAASFLQEHPDATFYVDEAAAADLTRLAEPWRFGKCPWDEPLQRRAVLWLARRVDQPILKLTAEGYADAGLTELLHLRGGPYYLNIEVFRHMMNTITGWPAGKGAPQRILVLSPHPDDDVICMGGTLMRLVAQHHDVHVAYMVSGYLSVFDHDVARYAHFVRDFGDIFGLDDAPYERIERNVDELLAGKAPGDMDTPEIRAIKALIRRVEALDAARYCGLRPQNVHFLDLPFYKTGKVQKLSLGDDDVARVRELLQQTRPQMVFAAGDLADPHGTHRLCLQAALAALDDYAAQNPRPALWLYRGAWAEWPPEQIDMAVPLSPDELRRKRYAIFRHQSQKDRAMFPGPYDSREFWQRAEDRNMATAATYDALGLPEYHALEAFARYPFKRPAAIAAQLEPPPRR